MEQTDKEIQNELEKRTFDKNDVDRHSIKHKKDEDLTKGLCD